MYSFLRPFDQKNPYLSKIEVNSELHTLNSDRSCRHVEFSVDSAKIRYEAGDHVAIFSTNDSYLVDKLAELLNVNLDTVFKLVNTDGMLIYTDKIRHMNYTYFFTF